MHWESNRIRRTIQIKSETASKIESEKVTSAQLQVPIPALALDNLYVNWWDLDEVMA